MITGGMQSGTYFLYILPVYICEPVSVYFCSTDDLRQSGTENEAVDGCEEGATVTEQEGA